MHTQFAIIEGDYSTYGSQLLAEEWEKIREPGLFGIEDGETKRFLIERGFNIISDLGPVELEHKYTTGADEIKKGRIWGCLRIVYASIHR